MTNDIVERIKWWVYFPRYELIYLLGGIPKQHTGGVIHYRNVDTVFKDLREKIEEANKPLPTHL